VNSVLHSANDTLSHHRKSLFRDRNSMTWVGYEYNATCVRVGYVWVWVRIISLSCFIWEERRRPFGFGITRVFRATLLIFSSECAMSRRHDTSTGFSLRNHAVQSSWDRRENYTDFISPLGNTIFSSDPCVKGREIARLIEQFMRGWNLFYQLVTQSTSNNEKDACQYLPRYLLSTLWWLYKAEILL
jgi:hypothetical protein